MGEKEFVAYPGFQRHYLTVTGTTCICRTCFVEKPLLSAFSINKSHRSGRQTKCKECVNASWPKYWAENRPRFLEPKRVYKAEYQKKNIRTIVEKSRIYINARKKVDPEFRLTTNLRIRMHHALVGLTKSGSSESLLGCPFSYFRLWIEAQFEPWMTWDNYGKRWEVDHERPCASFDMLDPVQQRQCFHYLNCRPLCKKANRAKGDKI